MTTKDDVETMRILFNADINELCNQRRWNDAKEMEGIRDRLIQALESQSKDCISRREAIKMFTYNYEGERIPDYDCDNYPVQIAIKTVKEMLRDLPPVTPKPDDALREFIASAVDDKMGYLNTCPNERNIILGIIRGKRYDTESHCGRDCNNTDCKSHPDYKPKEGHWIHLDDCANAGYFCSECRKKVIKDGWSKTVKKINYCPNCGSRMVESQERSGKS